MDAVTTEYESSQHGIATAFEHTGGRAACARCHTNEGFNSFAVTGQEVALDIANPTNIRCTTCHGNHRSLEDSISAPLTTMKPIVFITDTTSHDFGNASNMCGTCHQARRDGPSHYTAAGDSASIESSHDGPHHGPQANVLFGDIGFGASSTATHTTVGCVTCHMGEEDGTTDGGHTFRPFWLSLGCDRP